MNKLCIKIQAKLYDLQCYLVNGQTINDECVILQIKLSTKVRQLDHTKKYFKKTFNQKCTQIKFKGD